MLRQFKTDLQQKTPSEWAGPCDQCGGEDRFIYFLETGRFWCRQCEWNGDVIQYLREVKGMSYQEAAEQAGKEASTSPLQGSQKPQKEHSPFRAEQATPPQEWQQQAENFVASCHAHLMEGRAEQADKQLQQERGLSPRTIQKHGLGWNPAVQYLDRVGWGLPTDKSDKLRLPAGLVIPTFSPTVTRCRIRTVDGKPKYYILTGSQITWSRYGQAIETVMIVESDLDAMLINQELNICCYAMTSTALNPTRAEYDELMKSNLIIDALDSDKAGIAKSKQLGQLFGAKIRRFPPIGGKDPGDMHKAGIDLSEWYQAGMNYYKMAS